MEYLYVHSKFYFKAAQENEVTQYLRIFKFFPLYQRGLSQLKLLTVSCVYKQKP